MTLNELKFLVETNAVNLYGNVSIIDECVVFKIQELSVFLVSAYVINGKIVETVDDNETVYESGEAYAKFLRCEDLDSLK